MEKARMTLIRNYVKVNGNQTSAILQSHLGLGCLYEMLLPLIF